MRREEGRRRRVSQQGKVRELYPAVGRVLDPSDSVGFSHDGFGFGTAGRHGNGNALKLSASGQSGLSSK